MQNSEFWSRITSLHGTQASPVVLCMQYNSLISTRITCLYGPQPLSEVFSCKTAAFWAELQPSMGSRHNLSFCACKTVWLGPELQVSIGPSRHLWFLHAKQRFFGSELQVSMGTRPHLSFCACKTATFGTELLVSMGPSPHLWFLHAKPWLLDPNNKSLWVPDITCGFEHAIQRD